VWHTILLYNIF